MVSKFFVEEAIEAYNRAAQYIVTSYGGAHEKLASINKKMASIYFKIGDIDASIMFAEHSCEMYKAIYGHDHVEAIDNYLLLGLFHFARREYAAAEYYILDAIFVATVTYSECYPELLLLYLNLSTVYEAQHKYTDALFCLFRALDISLNVFGENHLHTAIILSALATSHYEIPDIAQSIKYQTRCLAIMEYVLPIEDNRVQ